MGLFDFGFMTDPSMAGLLEPQAAPFNNRFNAAFPQMQPNPNASPIAPEALAANAAARGIPPPPVDFTPPVINPTEPHRLSGPDAMDRWRQDADVGQALTGTNPPATGLAPMDIRTPVQQAAATAGNTDLSAQARGGEGQKGSLAEALKGVRMPAGPELQKLGTPAAPRISTAIKGGDLIALLHALNAAPGAGAYNLPSTLGAAIRK